VLRLGFENRSLGKESLGKETILEFAETRTAYGHTKEGRSIFISIFISSPKTRGEELMEE
jgi:hypothetical protein